MRIINRIGLTIVAATAVSVAAPSVANAAPGQLDPSFSGDGKVATNFTTGDDFANSVAIQPNGKIAVAGFSPSNGGQFVLARYNANGTLDSSFDGNGKLATNFTAGEDVANSVAIQPNGKIVVAGFSPSNGGQFVLARYNANGSLDSSFHSDGKLATNFTTSFDLATGVAIQSDGKIVAVGQAGGFIRGRFAFARYNANGSLDTSFDGNGKAAVDLTASHDKANDVAIQSDGKIVAVGGGFGVVRLNANGALDDTFGGDGKVTTDFGGGAHDVAIQPDGKIVAAGGNFDENDSVGRFAFVRYNGDGSLDTGFSGDGQALAEFPEVGTGVDVIAEGVAVQADGKIVAAGSATPTNTHWLFALARLNEDGSVDTGFGGDGSIITEFTSSDDMARDVAIQPDGKIVAVGRAAGSGGRFALARYLAD